MNLLVGNLETFIVLFFGAVSGGIPMFHWGKFIQKRKDKNDAKQSKSDC